MKVCPQHCFEICELLLLSWAVVLLELICQVYTGQVRVPPQRQVETEKHEQRSAKQLTKWNLGEGYDVESEELAARLYLSLNQSPPVRPYLAAFQCCTKRRRREHRPCRDTKTS